MQRAPYWYGVFETRIQTAEFVNVIPRIFKGKFLIRGPGSVACLQTEVICRKLEGKKFSLFSLSGNFDRQRYLPLWIIGLFRKPISIFLNI